MAGTHKLRLKIEKKRKDTETTRQILKENTLREGQLVDDIARVVLDRYIPLEEHLLMQEEFAKRAEEARLDERYADRKKKLDRLGAAPIDREALRGMEDAFFEAILEAEKVAYAIRERDRKEAAEWQESVYVKGCMDGEAVTAAREAQMLREYAAALAAVTVPKLTTEDGRVLAASFAFRLTALIGDILVQVEEMEGRQ